MGWSTRHSVIVPGLLVLFLLLAAVGAPDASLRLARATVAEPARFAAFLVVLYLLRPALAIPTTVAAAIVGFGYGIAVGIPVALLGTTVSSLPPYVLGTTLRREDGRFGRWCAAGEAFVSVTGETRGLLAARLAPTPSDPVSYAAGLASVGPRAFLVGTIVGELHWTVAAVAIGASARDLAAGSLTLTDPLPVLLATLLAVALIAGPVARHVADRWSHG